jgi:uncharacterized protein (TIGR00297 family)
MRLRIMLTSFLPSCWATTPERWALVGTVTLAFALLARALHGVNRSGAVAGGLACFLLFAGCGPAAFAALGALFVITWVSTRLGYHRKLALGLAERREGRNAGQILSNLAVAALASVAFGATGRRAFLVATAAALAEAATDTVASEIGQYRSSQPRMITSWKHVPAGTDGGITTAGTVAGVAGGLVVAIVAVLGGMIHISEVWIPMTAGTAGMLIDSILGATLQRRGWLSNQSVNFYATLAAAALAFGTVVLIN